MISLNTSLDDEVKKEKYKGLASKLNDIINQIDDAQTSIKGLPDKTKEGIMINGKSTTTGETNNTINDLNIARQRLSNLRNAMKRKS